MKNHIVNLIGDDLKRAQSKLNEHRNRAYSKFSEYREIQKTAHSNPAGPVVLLLMVLAEITFLLSLTKQHGQLNFIWAQVRLVWCIVYYFES